MRRAIVSWNKLAGNGNFVGSRQRPRDLHGPTVPVQ
jgi:hypothetical protein